MKIMTLVSEMSLRKANKPHAIVCEMILEEGSKRLHSYNFGGDCFFSHTKVIEMSKHNALD